MPVPKGYRKPVAIATVPGVAADIIAAVKLATTLRHRVIVEVDGSDLILSAQPDIQRERDRSEKSENGDS